MITTNTFKNRKNFDSVLLALLNEGVDVVTFKVNGELITLVYLPEPKLAINNPLLDFGDEVK